MRPGRSPRRSGRPVPSPSRRLRAPAAASPRPGSRATPQNIKAVRPCAFRAFTSAPCAISPPCDVRVALVGCPHQRRNALQPMMHIRVGSSVQQSFYNASFSFVRSRAQAIFDGNEKRRRAGRRLGLVDIGPVVEEEINHFGIITHRRQRERGVPLTALNLAPWSSSTFTTPVCPLPIAIIKGVTPLHDRAQRCPKSGVLTPAPCRSAACTALTSPAEIASNKAFCHMSAELRESATLPKPTNAAARMAAQYHAFPPTFIFDPIFATPVFHCAELVPRGPKRAKGYAVSGLPV